MEKSQIRNIILESSNPDWFKTTFKLLVAFNYSVTDPIELTGFLGAHDFFEGQIRGYSKLGDNLPSVLSNAKDRFSGFKKEMENYLHDNKNHDEPSLENTLKRLQQRLNNFLNDPNSPIFLSDSPEAEFLLALHKRYPIAVGSAVAYLNSQNLHAITTSDGLTGILQAYEFKMNDSTDILDRRRKEKYNVDEIRKKFQRFISEGEGDLLEFLKKSKEETESIAKQIDQLISGKKEAFDSWFEEVTGEEHVFSENSHNRIAELEELYKEKLKLEAPAKYWSDRAAKLRNEGNKWLTGMIITCIVALVALGIVLYFISDGTLKELFDRTGSAIRWSIVFITFVSFLAYGIRTFAKLTFSSYHLVRDAEEREQLVYVYLALVKDKGVDETERHLIMQSIFSRADTGLLKDDSSPTMPGNIVDKFMAK